jgi:voltage-gated potassium channel
MWWSVITLTTVGYGDVYPVTIAGKVAAGVIAVVGVGTVALPSGIIAGAFIERFRARRDVDDRATI